MQVRNPRESEGGESSNPTTVVGTGTAAVHISALQTAITKGGVVTFNCGKAPVTIALSATLTFP